MFSNGNYRLPALLILIFLHSYFFALFISVQPIAQAWRTIGICGSHTMTQFVKMTDSTTTNPIASVWTTEVAGACILSALLLTPTSLV